MARPSSVLWKHSWMAALAVLAVFCSAWWLTDRFEPLERRWYDLLVASTPLAPAPDLAVVAIDDASLAALGPWPWSRDLHARLIDTLNLAGARLVLLAVPLVGAEGEQALAQLQRIAGTVTDDPELAAHPRLPGLLLQAQEVLDADAHLVTGLTHNGHVLLAISAHRPAGTPNAEPIVQWPLAALGAAALGIGHIDWQTDADGTVRTLAPTLDVSGRRIPALALLALAQLRGDKIDTLQAQPDQRELSLGSSRLPLDRHGRLRPLLGNTARANIAHHSAQDVLSGRTPARALAGKVVLIGPTAVALLPPLQLPTQASVTPIDALALATAGMLHNQLISQPVWTELLAWLLLLGVVMHLTLLAPRLAPVSALALSSLIGTALLVSSHVAFTQTQIWLPPMLPLMGLLGGHAALLLWQLARRRWANERRTNPIDSLVDSATLDDPFELPSQQPEAPPPARPAPRQAAAAADRPAPPAVAAPAATTPAAPPPSTPRWPSLGRFQLDRELGHGAMGRVYLAHELESSRVVVIKTLALAQEFDGTALSEARRRFEREAEAAGRLQHPHIVRIYETGEERGIAYIAMEWLRGHNLVQHTQSGTLLPVADVLEIVARVADALAHAHTQGVIHRDIKPANIMIDPLRGDVTVTDFGIARIIDGRRTRTGLMLGSPLYMSPEQLLGRTVDGRSDLYALGVVLFQLLTTELPSCGDSIAELIQSVTSGTAPDVRTLRPELPQAVAEVVALALEKQPELRYRNGQDLADDLRLVAANLPDPSKTADLHSYRPPASVEDVALAARPPQRDADIRRAIVHNRPG